MSQTYLPQDAQTMLPLARRLPDVIIRFAVLILMTSMAVLSVRSFAAPDGVPATASASEFSSARALKHVGMIAGKPRPLGSSTHSAVRDYLLRELAAAGINPEIQKSLAVNPIFNGLLRAGTVENVVARLSGARNSKAILLVAHYDSVPTSNGASDNGAAVGALLETLRALRAGAPLNNDVIFLFSDGEEVGLLGAKAFVEEHPWARDVGVVFNFEARGTDGPSYLFETSEGNERLIKGFAEASPRPVGNSLAYEIYRLLPNDTDMSIFRRAGYPGLNFAYIDGVARYHTPLDNMDHLNERSLQHHGSHILSLTRHFGQLDLNNMRAGNAVYFNLIGSILVRYSVRWVVPLTVLAALAYVCLLVFGFRRKHLTLSGVVLGSVALLSSMIIAPLAVTAAWKLVSVWMNRNGGAPLGGTYHGAIFLISFTALTIAITSAIYILFGKRVSLANLVAGGLFWWLLSLLLCTLFIPGASYLFAWPLLGGLISWGYLLARGSENFSPKLWVVLILCAAPGIILLAPTVHQVFVGLTLNMIGPVMILVVLLMGILIPHLGIMGPQRKWVLPGSAALISFCFVAIGFFSSGDGVNTPRQNQILYCLDADTKKASWLSFDRSPDDWTAQFLTRQPEYRQATDLIPAAAAGNFPRFQAPSIDLEEPEVTLLGDTSDNGLRTLTMRVTSKRRAANLAVYITSQAEVVRAQLNGRSLESKTPFRGAPSYKWGLQYRNAPPEGIDLTLDLKSTEPLKLRVVDQSFDLPNIPGTSYSPRPAYIVSAPNPLNDSTVVSKSFVY